MKISIGKVISMISRKGTNYIDTKLKYLSLGHGQMRILIDLHEDDKISQDEIARRVCVDKTSLARTIKKLEELKYLKRSPNPNDNRAYEISLTAEGIEVRKKVIVILQEYISQLVSGFSKEDEALLYPLLEKLLNNSNNLM